MAEDYEQMTRELRGIFEAGDHKELERKGDEILKGNEVHCNKHKLNVPRDFHPVLQSRLARLQKWGCADESAYARAVATQKPHRSNTLFAHAFTSTKFEKETRQAALNNWVFAKRRKAVLLPPLFVRSRESKLLTFRVENGKLVHSREPVDVMLVACETGPIVLLTTPQYAKKVWKCYEWTQSPREVKELIPMMENLRI